MVGAGGTVGREVCTHLIAHKIIGPGERLQLVGHKGGPSQHGVHGLLLDVLDAFADRVPDVEVVSDPRMLRADVIVFLAGQATPSDPKKWKSRQEIGASNFAVFAEWAQILADVGTGNEVVLVDSNPVELAVSLFSQSLPRHHVLGGAAVSDSLRLRGEVAVEAGVRRRDIHIWALGQHGHHVMPAWSTLAVRGWSAPRVAELVASMTEGRQPDQLAAQIAAETQEVLAMITQGEAARARDHIETLPPDVRMAVRPVLVHHTGRTTAVATAHSLIEILRCLSLGISIVIPAQVSLDGEWPGFVGCVALPVVLGMNGWDAVQSNYLPDTEISALRGILQHINDENIAATRAFKAFNA